MKLQNSDMNNEDKKVSLKKMQRTALSLLGIIMLLFGVSLYYKIPALQAFSEAAMVGGIADWFAVVALFKHPLGIPIWHTAIIPTKKDEIGENLGTFVSEEFLDKEKLTQKLDEYNVSVKLANWLSQSQNADKLSNFVVVNIIPGILKTIKDEQIKYFITDQFAQKIKAVNFGDVVALLLEPMHSGTTKDLFLSKVFELLSSELYDNKDLIRKKVKQSTPFLSFGLADKRISEGVFKGLLDFIEEAKMPNSAVRDRIDRYVDDFLHQVKTSDEMRLKINTMVINVFRKEEVQHYLTSIWDDLKASIVEDIARGQSSKIRIAISQMIVDLGKALHGDTAMLVKLNLFVKNDVLNLLLQNKKVIGDIISSTVKSWDAKEMSEKLELEIGKDLQYIRINGTLVGGLVGLLIYGIEWTIQLFIL